MLLAGTTIVLVLVSSSAGSTASRAALSIGLALAALGTASVALRGLAGRSAPAEDGYGATLRSGPIFAVDLERELWRARPGDEIVVAGALDLVANVLNVMPPVDRLFVLTSLPTGPHPKERLSEAMPNLRHIMTLLRNENAKVHFEPDPVSGGVVQFDTRETLVSLPEFSRSKSGLPGVWLALRPEDNLALIEELSLDLSRRWQEARALDPGDLEDFGLAGPAW